MAQVRSIFAERISQGFYVNVEVNRTEAARYGLSVADVQTAVSSGIGGQNIAENIEGRERYPINVRYSQDFRDSLDRMRNVLIATPSGAQIPLGQVAQVSFSHGPAMIRDEDGQLTGDVTGPTGPLTSARPMSFSTTCSASLGPLPHQAAEIGVIAHLP